MNTVYVDNLTEDQETAVMDFMDDLPHGSGIDCDWHCTMKGDYVLFSNSYHCMNENGYYEGYQDFTVKLNKRDFMRYIDCVNEAERTKHWVIAHDKYTEQQLKRACVMLDIIASEVILQFNGNQYLATKHYLRDYLWDTISYSISSINPMAQ